VAGAALGKSTGEPSLATTERSLLAAERDLVGLRVRLAAIDVPAPARRLRALTLTLADRQIALTRELGRLEAFLPAFGSALKPLGSASRALQAALAVRGRFTPSQLATVDDRKAGALERFGVVLDSVASTIEKLHPPAVSLPAYRTQLASLEGMAAAGDHLATALRTKGSGGTAALVQFDRAATLSGTVSAQKAEITAVKAYDAEIASLRVLVIEIYKERSQLDTGLPD
jgi:hypothetical protein